MSRGWTCHDLLRRVQNAYLSANKPRAGRAFHARVAAYSAAEGDEEAKVEALYHGLMAGEEAAPTAWYETTHAAYLRLDWPRWSALLEIVESPELNPPLGLEAKARFWHGQWHRWRYEMDPALASYAQALALFRQVGARLGEANILLALAPFSENAKGVFRIALSLYETIGNHYSIARGLYYLGLYLPPRPEPARQSPHRPSPKPGNVRGPEPAIRGRHCAPGVEQHSLTFTCRLVAS